MKNYKHLLKLYFISLNSLIVIYLVLIALTYTSGGLSFSLLFIKIESYFLIKPAAILLALFILKTITDDKWRGFLKYILSIEGIGLFFLVSVAGLVYGLFSYDLEKPGIIIYYLSGRSIQHQDFELLRKYLIFHLILFNSVWIIFSRVVTKSRSQPLSHILNKDALIMSMGLLFLFSFIRYKVNIVDPQYIFFFRVIVLGLMVALKASLLKWDNEKNEKSNYFKAVIIATVVYFILFSILSIQKYNTFRMGMDFPIYIQSLWTSINGKLLYLNWYIYPDIIGKSYLGSHFELILLFFIPFYAVWKDPRILLVINSLMLAMTAIPIYIMAKDFLRNGYIAFSMAVVFLLSPLIQRANLWCAFPYAIEPFLVVLTFYFLQKKRFVQYYILLAFLLLVVESTSIFAILFGIYAFLFLKERKAGVLTVLAGFLWFLLTTQVLIPYFRGGPYPTFAERYPALGNNFLEVIKTFITKPYVPLSLLTDRWSLRGWGYLLIPVVFLPLLSLRGIIMIIPATSLMLLSNFSGMKMLGLHYPLSVIPFYCIGAILGLEDLLFKYHRYLPFIERIRKRIGTKAILTAIGSFMLTTSLLFNYYFDPAISNKFPFKWDYWIGNHHLSPSPTGRYFNPDFYRMNEHDKVGKVFINEAKKIIKEKPLSIELRFGAHFANRFLIRGLGDDGLPYSGWNEAEYIFFDIYGEPLSNYHDYYTKIMEVLGKQEFGIVAERDGYVLLRRGADPYKNELLIKKFSGRLEAEDMSYKTGTNTFDLDAVNKKARLGRAGIDKPDVLVFGHGINLQKGNYRAIFRIKTKANTAGGLNHTVQTRELVAIIDIAAEEGKILLSKKELIGIDFSDRNGYKEFHLNFSVLEETEIEPRVFFTSRQDLLIDKITIIPD